MRQTALGSTVSKTITVDVQVAVFAFWSVTVRVKVLLPRLLQVTNPLLGTKLKIPHASVLPAFSIAPVIVAFPEAFRNTEILVHKADGRTVSITITVVTQVLAFPFTSVTVKVTLFGPTFAQEKLVLLRDKPAIPHASVLLLFTAAGAIVALPEAFSCTVKFWQLATGFTVSTTITLPTQTLELPE